jgi:Fe-S-cluster containining protein
MDMDAIINDWKQNAERHDARNFKFLRSLKMKNKRAVDKAAHRLHREAFSLIECLQCANCCKAVNPTFTTEDIGWIAARLGMDAAAFTKEHLFKSEDRGLWKPKSPPCPFLGPDNRCTIYDARPKSCAEYPHTDKPGFASRTHLHSGNALQCPAVFYIIEQMRARGLKQGGR